MRREAIASIEALPDDLYPYAVIAGSSVLKVVGLGTIAERFGRFVQTLHGIAVENAEGAEPEQTNVESDQSSSTNRTAALEELKQAADLKQQGVLSEQEFEQLKAKLLDRM